MSDLKISVVYHGRMWSPEPLLSPKRVSMYLSLSVSQTQPLTRNITYKMHQDVTHLCSSTAEAISKVKDEQLPRRFRDVFFPDGQALRPGSFLRMASLAAVLEAGPSNFYEGNFSQEMEDEVKDVHAVWAKPQGEIGF